MKGTTITRWHGLCGGCLIRAKSPTDVVPGPVFRRTLRFFGEPLHLTEALCCECWRLLFELEQIDLALHRLGDEAEGES